MSKDTMTITRKVQLVPIGDKDEVNRAYKFIRDGMYAQYIASNLLMGELAANFYAHNRDLSDDDYKLKMKEILKYSNPILDDIEFQTGLGSKSDIIRKVQQDFQTSIKNGLARGERSITNYRRTNPLLVSGRFIKFTYEYPSYTDFLDNLYSPSLKVIMKFVNKIKFDVVFGNPHKSEEFRSVFKNIFEENYKVCGSSIGIEKNKIILNLTLQIPKKVRELDENTVVGVDLGLINPAVCALNNNKNARLYIGSADDFLRVRLQLQAQRKRLQKALSNTTGGHGRKKKLQALDRLKKREKNFTQSYNHMISRKIVDFALKHNAKYINIENLEGYTDKSENNFILRNWSYYQLQQYIQYKASMYGIDVRKVNPYNTSQICSYCGHYEEGQLVSQSQFICKNPNCESHKKDNKFINSDFNAARNIAKSTEWYTGKVSYQDAKKQHDDKVEELKTE